MEKKIHGEFLFLIGLFVFAILTTTGETIAWGLLPLFYALKYYVKSFRLPSIQKCGIVLILLSIIFCLNFIAIYSFKDFQIKIPHPDVHYYLKIASYFNQTGIENNLASKTVLFDNLDFATPYRFYDTWLLVLLLKICPLDDLTTLQAIFLPVLWFTVSYAVYVNIEFIKNRCIRVLLSISFLFLFGDYLTNFILFNAPIGELCVVSYPKLSIFFCVFIYYFSKQLNVEKAHDAILFLALLPILIQTSFPIYIFIFGYIITYYKYFLSNKRVLIPIILSAFYFVIFYSYNTYLSKEVFKFGTFQYVKSFAEYYQRVVAIIYSLLKTKLLLFMILSLFLVLISNKNKRKIYIKMIVLAFGILLPSAFVYALFPSSPNSYQLMTNLIYPIFITLVFFMALDIVNSIKKYDILCYAFVISFAVAGLYNQYCQYGFFNVKDVFSSKNDKNFVMQSQQMLKNIKNPIGLMYWSNKNEKRNGSEHFDQYGTNFLIQLGARFDVVCLSIMQMREQSYSDKFSKHYSAIGIFQRNENLGAVNLEERFYRRYHFEYLMSDLPANFLPSYIKEDVVGTIYDATSKIYCYKLK